MTRQITFLMVLGMLPWTGLHAQKTATFKVSATVVEACQVATRQAVLSATCTPATTYFIGSKDARHAVPVIPAVLSTLTGVGTGQAVDHTLFGGIPATQAVPPADAADLVSVRVYY